MTGGGLDWIEAAVHLLRRAPAAAWARYYIGSLPFVAAVLFYWSDMSRNAFAWQSLTGGSLATAMAYLWMKCWQSAFAAELRFELEGGEPNQWSARRVGRMILFQTAVQPSGLFVIPAGLLMTIPFPAIMAFYQGFSMTGDGSGEEDLRATISRTLKLAGLWTRQNSAVLGILLVFGLFVFLNLAVGLLFVPELLRMYLGVDSVFTRAGANVLGSTFFAVCCGLTYLVLDPLLKAHGALRCFHGESVHTGADLRSQLRREMRRIQSGALVAAMLCCGAANTAAKAETLDPGRLDKSIGEVLKKKDWWIISDEIYDLKENQARLASNSALVSFFSFGLISSLSRSDETLGRRAAA